MSGARWRTLHVAHFDPDADALVCDGVQPLFESLDVPAYFLRHWRRGVHLRLNIHCDAESFSGQFKPAALDLIGGHLARHPSRAQPDLAQWYAIHQRKAHLDNDPRPLVPFYEDNSINDAEYEPPLIGFGGVAATQLLEDFYCATNSLVSDVCRRVRHGQSRIGVLFDVWLATARALAGGYEFSWTSYRSSADKFRYAAGDSDRYIDGWSNLFDAQRPGLVHRAELILRGLDEGTESSPIADEWVATLVPFRERALELVAAGEIDFPLPPEDSGSFALAELTSPFHRALMTQQGWYGQTGNVNFAAYRVMLALTYAHGARAGISLVERWFLCYLVASTMEAITGLDGVRLVQSDDYFQRFFEDRL
ncbi:lantibiotic dehydratase C-terminal domain-containing protein [Nocardia sp. NPDC003979]